MKIFIVPYRNRGGQLRVFLSHMKYLLEDHPVEEYRIYIAQQADNRPFNRGAMRNIGFLEAKKEVCLKMFTHNKKSLMKWRK